MDVRGRRRGGHAVKEYVESFGKVVHRDLEIHVWWAVLMMRTLCDSSVHREHGDYECNGARQGKNAII